MVMHGDAKAEVGSGERAQAMSFHTASGVLHVKALPDGRMQMDFPVSLWVCEHAHSILPLWADAK